MVLSLSVTLCLSLSLSQLLSPLCLNVFDLCLHPVLHPNAHPMPTSLGFSRSCGFHRRSKLWVSLGFIVEAAIAFLSLLLWFSADQTQPTSFPPIKPTPTLSSSSKPSSMIGDFLFCLWLVILFGLGWGKRLEISVGGFIFFLIFFFCCGLVVVVMVVVVVVVTVADGRGGCGWWCGCFLGNELYYFIVRDILFYCDVYIVLLRWKLK